MSKETVEKHLLSIFPMPIEKLKMFSEHCEFLETEGKTTLIKENKICSTIYYLEEGFIRSYVIGSEGEEITTNIYTANSFIGDYFSCFNGVGCRETIATITDCKLWTLSNTHAQESYQNLPEFGELARAFTVNDYSALQERNLSMIHDPAEIRYMQLLEKNADIVQNVPLKIIASYLGITDTSLSRIRKNISQ